MREAHWVGEERVAMLSLTARVKAGWDGGGVGLEEVSSGLRSQRLGLETNDSSKRLTSVDEVVVGAVVTT